MINVYFSDLFEVAPDVLETYGALDISLINDLPLFIDPFLLFNSDNSKYQQLHSQIIDYLRFIRDQSASHKVDDGLLQAWYFFKEVKQNWLGYSRIGNSGSGLGKDFAKALNQNLNSMFTDFGNEKIARGSHLEKLALVSTGVGRDNISDFTVNLIKEFLLDYTQEFAQSYVAADRRRIFAVPKVRFNYQTQVWESRKYELPYFRGDFVLLTPKDLLTKDDMWISRPELVNRFDDIALAVPNEQLRSQINNYFASQLPREPKKKDYDLAAQRTIISYPAILEYYIRQKEDQGDRAVSISSKRVAQSEELFIQNVRELIGNLLSSTPFYRQAGNTYDEARERVMFLKDVIENKDGYRIFYAEGKPIKREQDLQILFRLTWFATTSDVNREVNNGRGPVDFKISRGSRDKSLVEFKLASNSQLKRNLENQVEIYQKASDTKKSLKVILFFTEEELRKMLTILNDLRLSSDESIILIDARSDNKPSASKA